MARERKRGRSEGAKARPSVPGWSFVERVLGCDLVRTVYLHGPPGVGKTYVAYHQARGAKADVALGAGIVAITLTEETPAAELRGFWAPRNGELVWLDGPFTQAMRDGAVLVINEIGHASPDVLALLYPVLESAETARLTLPTGETLHPAPGFRVIATDNEPPSHLPEALRDRFDCILEIDRPHPAALERLSPALRHAAEQTFDLEPERRLGLRPFLTVEKLQHSLGLEDACLAVFGAERGGHVYEAISLAAR